MTVEVRDAVEADLPATLEIFNELIETTTIAWTERRQTLGERRAWFAEQQRRGFATLVAVEDGAVVGGASYGDFRDTLRWPGYRYTAELTIHVRGDRRRSGIGRLLMHELFARARRAGLHVLVAGIDSGRTDANRRLIAAGNYAGVPQTRSRSTRDVADIPRVEGAIGRTIGAPRRAGSFGPVTQPAGRGGSQQVRAPPSRNPSAAEGSTTKGKLT